MQLRSGIQSNLDKTKPESLSYDEQRIKAVKDAFNPIKQNLDSLGKEVSKIDVSILDKLVSKLDKGGLEGEELDLVLEKINAELNQMEAAIKNDMLNDAELFAGIIDEEEAKLLNTDSENIEKRIDLKNKEKEAVNKATEANKKSDE
jgi:hypothetical protein